MKLTNLVLILILTPFLAPSCNHQPSKQPPVKIKQNDAAVKRKSVDAVLIRKRRESLERRAAQPVPVPDIRPEGLRAQDPFLECKLYDSEDGTYVTVEFLKGCAYWEVLVMVVFNSDEEELDRAVNETARIMVMKLGTTTGMILITTSVAKDPEGYIHPISMFGIPKAIRI